jgi:hypothetical protein
LPFYPTPTTAVFQNQRRLNALRKSIIFAIFYPHLQEESSRWFLERKTFLISLSFQKNTGWAPIGEEYRRSQINIGTRTFSTVAVFNILGFVSWQIFEGSCIIYLLILI